VEAAHQEKAPLDSGEVKRVLALVALCALNVVFWAVYEQQGNTMQSWADERTVWPVLFGFQVPSTWFQSFNPMMIILLAPLLDGFWRWQQRKGTEPSSVSKMAIGCVLLGLSFIVMILGAQAIGSGKGSPFWPLFCTALLTVGELYLSPIGLSLVTKVSPARIVSMMMGIWLSTSFTGCGAGWPLVPGLSGLSLFSTSGTSFFRSLRASESLVKTPSSGTLMERSLARMFSL